MKLIHTIEWTSPSNIALVKYWGKFGDQLPKNPSVSFTLKHAVTTMKMEVFAKDAGPISLEFFFEGKSNQKFHDKIQQYLEKEKNLFPWLEHYHVKISSSNTFPHSSGIASSASSMSALCLCLLSADELISKNEKSESEFFKQASELSRLASGSAGRSIYSTLASWGECKAIRGSSNHYASKFEDLHPYFHDYCDSILIVSDKEKVVSSRAGHSLMVNHPYKDARYDQANANMIELTSVLKKGDIQRFNEIVEEEALSLHALMLTSRPSFILLQPESLALILKIREFREETQVPACFTIDAGPNIHLLYPAKYAARVKMWIEKDLAVIFPGLKWIHDEVGMGPVRLQ